MSLERGSSANDTFCRPVIALADNGNEASDKQLLERAREIFAEGRRRLSYKKGLKRRDAGVQRATTSDPKDEGGPKTEAEWLRKRHRDLDEALIETPPPKRAATADDFTPEMKKEAKHLQGVIERRRMEAQANGTFLEFEKASSKKLKAWQQNLKQEDAKRVRKDQEKASLWEMASQKKSQTQLQNMVAGKTVWLPSGEAAGLRQTCLNLGAHATTSELGEAAVFIVDNLNPEKKAQWAAVVQGGILISRTVLEPNPCAIFALHFKRGTAEKCILHITQAFQEKCPSVSDFLHSVVLPADPHSSWTLHDDPNKALVVLCVSKEMKKMKKRGRATCTAEDFLMRTCLRNLCPATSGRC